MNGSIRTFLDFAAGQGLGFIRIPERTQETDEGLKEIDKALKGYSGYLRIDRLEPLSDTALIERCRSESVQFSRSRFCEKLLNAYRSGSGTSNQTTENNLIVCVMYWAERYLRRIPVEIQLRKLVYTGKCGYKEYLFCYYASLIGFDVLVCPEDSFKKIPAEMLGLSAEVRLVLNMGKAPRQTRSPAVPPANAAPRQPQRRSISSYTPPRGNPAPPQSVRQPVTAQGIRPGTDMSAKRTAPPAPELRAAPLMSVVTITGCDGGGTPRTKCSGIVIGANGFILTHFSTIKNCPMHIVSFGCDPASYSSYQIIKYHTDFDLAVIRICRVCEPFRIYSGDQEPLTGETAYAAVISPQGTACVTEGRISGQRAFNNVEMIQFTAPVNGLITGGALLDGEGRLRGMFTPFSDERQGIHLAVSSSHLLPFVRGFINY